MSLFRSCDWWVGSCEGQQDVGSLVVDSLAGEGEGEQQQVVVVSQAGLVQIFQPQHRPGGESRAEDLLLETQLAQPVLQVETGALLSQGGRQLAILHPSLLSVYQLSRRQGSGSQGDSYVLSLAYQHALLRSAYTMTRGPFGGIKGRHYLAVLSLDGTISIFEQETHTFSRFLPGFLMPGLYSYESDDSPDWLVVLQGLWSTLRGRTVSSWPALTSPCRATATRASPWPGTVRRARISPRLAGSRQTGPVGWASRSGASR